MDNNNYAKKQKDKERMYRATFRGVDEQTHLAGQEVLADLRIYCNATKSSFSSDIAEMARMEGRREVFNRIMSFLKVDYEEYFDLIESDYE